MARALVANPTVGVRRPPTGALDSVAADDVMELLVDATREQRIRVLMVTYEPRVAAYADRTVMVRDDVEARRSARHDHRTRLAAAAAGGRGSLLRLYSHGDRRRVGVMLLLLSLTSSRRAGRAGWSGW